jgi:hypothetical protein
MRWLAVLLAVLCAGPGDAQPRDRGRPAHGSIQDPRTDPGRAKASPPNAYAEQRQPWLLGELLFGREYRGTVTVINECGSQQRFGLFTYDLPDVAVAPTVTLAAGETARLPYVLSPRQRPSATAGPVKGELVIWRPGSGAGCPPLRVVHVAVGRVRSATPEDERAEMAALQDHALRAACVMWWLRGAPPGAAQIETLPEAARPGARNLRQRLAEEDRSAGSGTWAWLPDAAAFDRMSIAELAAFRRRVVDTDAAGQRR